jgi:signal transduction histidine kinase
MRGFRLTTPPRMGFNLKILLTLSAILLGFAVASGLTFSLIQRQDIKNHLCQQGKLMVVMLSGALQSGLFFEDHASIDQAVKTLLAQHLHKDLQAVAVYDAKDGVILRQIEANTSDPANAKLIGPMATALASFHQKTAQKEIWESNDLLIFTTPVSVVSSQRNDEALYFDTDKGPQTRNIIGYAQLVLGKHQFYEESAKTVLRTMALTISFLLIALAATYMLTRVTLAPLKRLIDTIRTREGGQETAEPDEVGLLGDAFSRLVDGLENAFATIHDLKDSLEVTVEERTVELSQALTELRETHIQLAQSEKMVAIGRLVAGIAHEINNTTNFVSGALPPLRKRLIELEGLFSSPEREQPNVERCTAIFASINTLMENINEGARRTNKIMGDLKSFSRPVNEEPAPVDINHCLTTTCSLAYPEFKYRIELTLDLAENLPLVEGAQGQLNQVFMNLLLNAMQAQPGNGTILIRTWFAEDKVHVLIRDSGHGIPADVIDRIFEPFFTTKKVGKGTGLGLSISYGIIKKHQGEILVRSEPGSGTEFEIILPLKRQQELPNTQEGA